jgi:hypothetical protein
LSTDLSCLGCLDGLRPDKLSWTILGTGSVGSSRLPGFERGRGRQLRQVNGEPMSAAIGRPWQMCRCERASFNPETLEHLGGKFSPTIRITLGGFHFDRALGESGHVTRRVESRHRSGTRWLHGEDCRAVAGRRRQCEFTAAAETFLSARGRARYVGVTYILSPVLPRSNMITNGLPAVR